MKRNTVDVLHSWLHCYQLNAQMPTADPARDIFGGEYPAKDVLQRVMSMMTPVEVQQDVVARCFLQDQLN